MNLNQLKSRDPLGKLSAWSVLLVVGALGGRLRLLVAGEQRNNLNINPHHFLPDELQVELEPQFQVSSFNLLFLQVSYQLRVLFIQVLATLAQNASRCAIVHHHQWTATFRPLAGSMESLIEHFTRRFLSNEPRPHQKKLDQKGFSIRPFLRSAMVASANASALCAKQHNSCAS